MTTDVDIATAQQLSVAEVSRLPAERICVDQALGRVVAATVVSSRRLPAANVSVMDGWALASSDLVHAVEDRLQLGRAGESSAGHPWDGPWIPHAAVQVSTGAVVPEGADVVVAREDVEVTPDSIIINLERTGPLSPGHYIRWAGSDVAYDLGLVATGEVLGVGSVALLAAVGERMVDVIRAPRVALLCTGDELVPVGHLPRHGQVVNSNGLMLTLQARLAGAEVIGPTIVRDSPAAVKHALATISDADVIVTCGGISVGDHDLVLPAALALGASVRFRRVVLRPGRPTTLMSLPGPTGPRPVFALPGNPAAAHVAFELFVRPALRVMQGDEHWAREHRSVVLAGAVFSEYRRTHMVRAHVIGDQAHPLYKQESGSVRSLVGHNALLEIPAGGDLLPVGTQVQAWMIGLG